MVFVMPATDSLASNKPEALLLILRPVMKLPVSKKNFPGAKLMSAIKMNERYSCNNPSELLLGVHRIDLFLIALANHRSLHFERRGKFPSFDG